MHYAPMLFIVGFGLVCNAFSSSISAHLVLVPSPRFRLLALVFGIMMAVSYCVPDATLELMKMHPLLAVVNERFVSCPTTCRSEGVPERRISSLGALLGWVVRDSVFLVLVVLVGRGGATRRDPFVVRYG